MVKTSELNSFEKRIYLLPKYNAPMIYTKNVGEALEYLEDFELDELTENEIKNKIDEYNKEKELSYFDRLKLKDFILLKATIYKIGKHKFAKINTMENIK